MSNQDKPEPTDVLNPGDKVPEEGLSEQEKSERMAVDQADITGDHIEVPTYFEVKEQDGETKKLHHIKDADEISDAIRQARTDEEGNRTWR